MEIIFKVNKFIIHPLVNFWIRKIKRIPLIDNRYICIVDRENKTLAALVVSRINRPGYYVPVFLFPRVGASAREGNLEKEDNYISQIIGDEARILIDNSIARIHGCNHVILVGLSENQKSFLKKDKYDSIIEIHNETDIEKIPGLDQRLELRCRKEEILQGLYLAGIQSKKLMLDNIAATLPIVNKKASGCIIGEDVENAESIIAANYAIALNAGFATVESLIDREEEEIQQLIQDWYEKSNKAALKSVLERAEKRIEKINFLDKKFVTFFTEGLPYSLYLKNIIPCSYVNISLRPDLFVMNGLIKEHMQPFGSAIVFSPEFFPDEETENVLKFFKQNNFLVQPLIGQVATVRNLDFYTQHFPYDLLHICSHGGEVDGYAVIEEFTDRKGMKHVVEYDEVVGFSPVQGKDLIEVHQKTIFRKFDGFLWMSKELKMQGYQSYVFEDMRKEMHQNEKLNKEAKRQHRNRIPTSCAIKCADSIHQGMFRILASHSSPIIFNNTCWSWFEVAKFFLAGGARGYIGTLWAIGNTEAIRGAETFYANIEKGETILKAFHKGLKSISNTASENIYIYWGLHFSRLKISRSYYRNRRRVLRNLLQSLFMWFKKIKTTKSDEVRKNSIEVAKNLCNEIIRGFKPEEVESINPKAKELLSEIANKQSVRANPQTIENTTFIDHPSEFRSKYEA